ncbi:MAG: DUF72 domain-containing protein [Candidatus Marinimicrobia bacterium]|nr:DUF72 domain-containing protein [Candidatus Neomarinimicrobiota bacterium]
MVYNDHYPSKKAFRNSCLREYARHFPAVGVDATFYRFPSQQQMERLADLTPPHFRFGTKVTEEITVYKYPTHPRYGERRGKINPNFLRADLFREQFHENVGPLGEKLGPMIFQFGSLPREIIDDGTFLGRLEDFLAELPQGYRYATEIRNRQLFNDQYFDVLRRNGVAHVHTSWSWMPALAEQLAMAQSMTAAFFVMRLLTPPHMAYGDAVESFFPYTRIQRPQLETRQALQKELGRAIEKQFPGYVFINNRLEGASPLTIEQVLDRILEDRQDLISSR